MVLPCLLTISSSSSVLIRNLLKKLIQAVGCLNDVGPVSEPVNYICRISSIFLDSSDILKGF
jgi:hypothetical protein